MKGEGLEFLVGDEVFSIRFILFYVHRVYGCFTVWFDIAEKLFCYGEDKLFCLLLFT